MKMRYKKLWKMLIDKEMGKKELADSNYLSQYTINKLNRGETETIGTLVKIYTALTCNIGDICDVIIGSCDNKEKIG